MARLLTAAAVNCTFPLRTQRATEKWRFPATRSGTNAGFPPGGATIVRVADHKGYGIALLVEIPSSVLTGAVH
jgi:hypothetical protein